MSKSKAETSAFAAAAHQRKMEINEKMMEAAQKYEELLRKRVELIEKMNASYRKEVVSKYQMKYGVKAEDLEPSSLSHEFYVVNNSPSICVGRIRGQFTIQGNSTDSTTIYQVDLYDQKPRELPLHYRPENVPVDETYDLGFEGFLVDETKLIKGLETASTVEDTDGNRFKEIIFVTNPLDEFINRPSEE